MAEFLRTLLGISITGGIFILAAVLIRAGVKTRLPKHFLVLLWGAVLLHFIFVIGTPSPTSIYNYIYFRDPAAIRHDAPGSAAIAADRTAPAVHGEGGFAASASASGQERASVLFIVWLAGAGILLAVFIGNYLHTVRRFSCAFLLKNNPVVNQWKGKRKNPPTVYVSDRTTTPLAFGLFRPRIVLPSGLDLTNAPMVESILEHEYIHGRHFHNTMKVLVYLVVAMHWFNPVVWLYWFLFNHDIELACDESVINSIGPSRRAEYAHSLVAVAERALTPFPLVSAFSARNLKERIVDVMGYKRTTTSLIAAELALIAVVFALFGTSEASNTTDPVQPQQRAAQPSSPNAVRTYEQGTDPLAVALSLTGGGTVVRHEVESSRGGHRHEYQIVTDSHKYDVLIDTGENGVVKYEREEFGKPFPPAATDRIAMDQAVSQALALVPGASVSECELQHDKAGRYYFEIELRKNGSEYEIIVDAHTGKAVIEEADHDEHRQRKRKMGRHSRNHAEAH